MTPRQLRAPAIDGGLLVEPPPSRVPAILSENRTRLASWDYDFQGRTASRLREQVRREVVGAVTRLSQTARPGLAVCPGDAPIDATSPLVVTGHQPELFHPGVWIKNFAISGIAARHRGAALNLIVDNDLPKSASIRVPRVEAGLIRTTQVDFDRWGGEIPYEDLRVQEEDLFATFADRTAAALRDALPPPLLGEFWPKVLARRGETGSLGLRFALARRELEASWGASNLEVPLSSVCQTDGFSWFVCHLLAHLPRYVQIHNEALGGIPAGARNSQQEPPRRRPSDAGRMARGPVLGLAPWQPQAPWASGSPARPRDRPEDRRRG